MDPQIIVIRMWDKCPDEYLRVNTTSKSKHWTRELSPFYIGPCPTNIEGVTSVNMENAWQYAKVYKNHVDEDGNPTEQYYNWARLGYDSVMAHRYPMGKGKVPEYSWWNGKKLGYVDARKEIYMPLYAEAVRRTEGWRILLDQYKDGRKIALLDYDAYRHDQHHMTLHDVLHCETKKMGHAFVLACMLTEVPWFANDRYIAPQIKEDTECKNL